MCDRLIAWQICCMVVVCLAGCGVGAASKTDSVSQLDTILAGLPEAKRPGDARQPVFAVVAYEVAMDSDIFHAAIDALIEAREWSPRIAKLAGVIAFIENGYGYASFEPSEAIWSLAEHGDERLLDLAVSLIWFRKDDLADEQFKLLLDRSSEDIAERVVGYATCRGYDNREFYLQAARHPSIGVAGMAMYAPDWDVRREVLAIGIEHLRALTGESEEIQMSRWRLSRGLADFDRVSCYSGGKEAALLISAHEELERVRRSYEEKLEALRAEDKE